MCSLRRLKRKSWLIWKRGSFALSALKLACSVLRKKLDLLILHLHGDKCWCIQVQPHGILLTEPVESWQLLRYTGELSLHRVLPAYTVRLITLQQYCWIMCIYIKHPSWRFCLSLLATSGICTFTGAYDSLMNWGTQRPDKGREPSMLTTLVSKHGRNNVKIISLILKHSSLEKWLKIGL